MCLAIPGRVIEFVDTAPLTRTAVVTFGGARKQVSLALLPEADVGDYVLVHVGFAISRISEEEAAQIYTYLDEVEAIMDAERISATTDTGIDSGEPQP